MSGKYVIGVDNGGTVTKACLYDANGTIVASASVKVPLITPRPLFTERDSEAFWQANVTALKECLASSGVAADEIACIALTGHGNGLYLSAEDGSPSYNGIISTDGRAQSYVDAWSAAPDFESRARSKTLSSVWAGQPVALLAWLDDNEPEVFDKTAHVFMAKDYIRFRLTGVANLESTDASLIAMMDVRTKEFDSDIFDFFGIGRWFDKLPPQVGPTEVAATVTAEAATLTGLLEGTPVAGGTVDVAASPLASGLVDADKLCVITGTWSINEFVSRDPILDADPFITCLYPVPDTWLVMEASPNGVSNLEWYLTAVLGQTLRRFGGVTVPDSQLFATCEELIGEISPEVDDPFFVPFINGSGIVPNGRAAFVGLTTYHDVRHLVRAVYEGVIFSHLYDVKRLRGYRKLEGPATYTGGAANSQMWTQMFADALGIPLEVVDAQEAGTLGAAILACVAAGLWPDVPTAAAKMTKPPRVVVEPNPANADLWQARYDRFAAHLDSQRG